MVGNGTKCNKLGVYKPSNNETRSSRVEAAVRQWRCSRRGQEDDVIILANAGVPLASGC